jgi:hypothetical protein
VEAEPLVRSSYHAAEQVRALSQMHHQLYGLPPAPPAPEVAGTCQCLLK